MNKLVIFALLALTLVSANTEPQVEEGVYVLNDSNFNDFVSSKPFVLAEFYAPWCGHCKSLAPEYAKAAQQLATENKNVFLAKIDATESKELATKFAVQGFPTLKFFTGSLENPIEYNGGRKQKDIVNWLNKRTGTVSELISDNDSLTAFLQKHSVAVVYFGESETDSNWAAFKQVAMSNEDAAFAHVFISDIRAEQGAQNSPVVLYKHFDEKRNDFEGQLTSAALDAFIDKNGFPNVLPFSDRAIQRVFQQGNPTLFLFSNENEASLAAEKVFSESALANKGKLIFSVSKVNDGFGHYQRLADYVGVNTAQAPQVMLVHAQGGVQKYKFESQITTENVNDFVSRYLEGKVERYLKSEEPPANNDEPVKVIVGKTFKQLVLDTDQDVLVEFYAPWCGHCKTLAPKYEAAAKKLAHNKNIVIAKMDSTANEVTGVNIKGFPTIKFYPNGKKDSPVDYDGDRDEQGILKWLKDHVTHQWQEVRDEL